MNNKLKCFFAFSNDIESNQIYTELLIATLESAKKNTSLDLYCLYDGIKDDKLYKILKKYGVEVYITSIPFFDDLKRIYNKKYLHKIDKENVTDSSLKARFLRLMLSQFTKDEYILYCDTDLIFLKDITLADFPFLPKTIAVCPEFEKTQDYEYFNAGVMLINTKSYAEKYEIFLNMIKNGKYASEECFDQGYLNDLFKDEFEKLPLEYNWKAYWGYNENIKILHFHGLKPNEDIEYDVPYLRPFIFDYTIYHDFFKNYGLYCEYSRINKKLCLERLKKTLELNLNNDFKFRKKIKKLQNKINILVVIQIIMFIYLILVTI